MRWFRPRLAPRVPTPARRLRVALNRRPRKGPYGGGNQFLTLLQEYLTERGHTVVHRLDGRVDVALLLDPRPGPDITFTVTDLDAFHAERPDVPVVHRINECDLRKGTSTMDEALRQANRVADHTVFVSGWLRDYFAQRWFERSRPHEIVLPGADPRVFRPPRERRAMGEICRIVTHHWSDNWMKGFRLYQAVDEAIADGRLPGFRLTVIGRWPAEIQWKTAQTHPPTRGGRLAALLQANDLYLTASAWDPGPMHTAEAAQCGLPIVFHEDGGGIVEFARRCGLGFRDDVVAALQEARGRHAELQEKALGLGWTGVNMCQAYEQVLLRARRAPPASSSSARPAGPVAA